MASPPPVTNPSCTRVQHLLDSMAECASELRDSRLLPPAPLVRIILPLFAQRQQLTRELRSLSQDPSPQRSTSQGPALISTYAQLVTALVLQLARLEPTITERSEHTEAFLELWRCLHVISLTFTHFWAMCQPCVQVSLNAANHALMVWMLSFMGSEYHLYLGPDIEERCSQITAIMQIPLSTLTHISGMAGQALSPALAALHPDYLPLLCRIACEAVGSLADAQTAGLRKLALQATAAAIRAPDLRNIGRHPTPVSHEFELLVALVLAVAKCSMYDPRNPRLLAAFTAPSTLEACKMVIVLCGPQRGVALLPQGDSVVLVLLRLINQGMHVMIARAAEGLPSVPPPRRASAGPNLVPPQRQTDSLLLDTLGERVANDPETAFLTFQLMGVLVQSWRQAEEGAPAPVPTEVMTQRDLCCVRLSHRCMLHARNWMLTQRTGSCGAVRAGQQQRQQQRQPQQRQDNKDPQGCFGKETMQHVQSLMELMCMIALRIQRSGAVSSPKSTPAELRRRLLAHQARFQAVCLRHQASPGHDRSEGDLLVERGQALERELQHALRHYASSTLLAWSRLPGCVWTLESVLRDEHQPTGSQQVCHASLIAANLMQSGAPGAAACTPAFLSLAATGRKLLHAHTGCGAAGPGAQRGSDDGLNHHPPGQTLTLEGARGVLSTLSEGVAVVGRMLEGGAGKRGGPSGGGGGAKSSAATPKRKARMPHIPHPPKVAVVEKTEEEEEEEEGSPAAGASPAAAVGRRAAGSGASAGAGLSPPSHQSRLHQLQAIQVAGIVQLCHWQLGHGRAAEGGTRGRAAPAWLTELRGTLKVVVGRELCELVDLLLSAALVVPSDEAQLGVDVALERYAQVHFHGRLLPGCCHLGCANMAGVCEAALPTQLCGGCRRSRYCSVACQRAAWVAGHGAVCGKHWVGGVSQPLLA